MSDKAAAESNPPPKKHRKKQEDFYTGLPNWIYDSPKLTPNDRDFLMFLARHSNKNEEFVWPSEPKILAKCKIGIHKYFHIRKKLTELGLIGYISGRGRKHPNLYRLNWLKSSDEELAKLKENIRGKKRYAVQHSLKYATQHSLNYATQHREQLLQGNNFYKGTTTEKIKKPDAVASFSHEKGEKPNRLDRIMKLGITKDRAWKLLADHPYQIIENQLEWLPHRKNIENPAGAFIKAVEENWPEPVIKKRKTREGWEESEKYKKLYSRPSQRAFLEVIKKDLEKYGISEERLKEWKEKLDPKLQPELDKWVEENRDRLKKRRKRD